MSMVTWRDIVYKGVGVELWSAHREGAEESWTETHRADLLRTLLSSYTCAILPTSKFGNLSFL